MSHAQINCRKLEELLPTRFPELRDEVKEWKGLEHLQMMEFVLFTKRACHLRGHPNPAMWGHFKTGHTKSPERPLNLGCGKVGGPAALGIAEPFPLSHNLNNSIILLD